MIKFILDAVFIVVSFILAYFFRFRILLFVSPPGTPVLDQYVEVLIFIMLIWLALFKLIGLYEEKRFSSLIDELALVFLGVSLATLVMLGMLFLYREFWFSRLVVVNAWWIAFFILAVVRIVLFTIKRRLRLRGWGIRNALILGAGEMGQVLAAKISQDRTLGYRILGFLDDDQAKRGKTYYDVRVLAEVAAVSRLIKELKIEEVIIASSKFPAQKVLDIITECERYGIEFKLVPGILELIASRVDSDELGGIPLLTVSEIQLKGFNALVKRATDILLSVLCLIILSPLLLIFALLVKVTSAGPAFIFQDRVGLDGKTFKMFKFRSMVENAEALFPELAPLSETEGNIFKMKNDPRITPLGKFMRRRSIDELPQLLNVVFGQMSMVGPRPPLPREVVKYTSWHMKRLRVRPGITGPWQVSGRSLLPFEEMVRLDIHYIENWSLWLDLKILLRTVPVVVFGQGAY